MPTPVLVLGYVSLLLGALAVAQHGLCEVLHSLVSSK